MKYTRSLGSDSRNPPAGVGRSWPSSSRRIQSPRQDSPFSSAKFVVRQTEFGLAAALKAILSVTIFDGTFGGTAPSCSRASIPNRWNDLSHIKENLNILFGSSKLARGPGFPFQRLRGNPGVHKTVRPSKNDSTFNLFFQGSNGLHKILQTFS